MSPHFLSKLWGRLDLSTTAYLIGARYLMAPVANSFESWAFDVSALMVLIGEPEELRYRLAGRSLLECLVAAPAAGLQSYLKSYEVLLDHSHATYFSPYGCKTAPLRNMKLDNAIRHEGLLEDRNFNIYRISSSKTPGSRGKQTWTWILALWTAFTWLVFLAILLSCSIFSRATWIGFSSCVTFTGWSLVLRLVEYHMVHKPLAKVSLINGPNREDAVVLLGRGNSALILRGGREDIKNWTSGGLIYKDRAFGLPKSFWQSTTRVMTLLVLIFIFTTIPNGSPMDQLMFVVLNVVGQANVVLGHWLNSKFCLSSFYKVKEESAAVETRTEVYARILRQFKEVGNNDWIDKVALLPNTPIWREWAKKVVEKRDKDPKSLYDEISDNFDKARGSPFSSEKAKDDLNASQETVMEVPYLDRTP